MTQRPNVDIDKILGKKKGGNNPPYGYRWGGMVGVMEENPSEQAVILMIKEGRAAKKSYSRIADTITKLGYKNRVGGDFKKHNVETVVNSLRARGEDIA